MPTNFNYICILYINCPLRIIQVTYRLLQSGLTVTIKKKICIGNSVPIPRKFTSLVTGILRKQCLCAERNSTSGEGHKRSVLFGQFNLHRNCSASTVKASNAPSKISVSSYSFSLSISLSLSLYIYIYMEGVIFMACCRLSFLTSHQRGVL